MGWWCLNKLYPTGAEGGGLRNAFPDRDSIEDYYCGDQPLDVLHGAFNRIDKMYREHWGRRPYAVELAAIVKNALCEQTDEEERLREVAEALIERLQPLKLQTE